MDNLAHVLDRRSHLAYSTAADVKVLSFKEIIEISKRSLA